MSFSHEYNLPVFIGTGATLATGGTDKLVAGQIGFFDAKTYQVPTGPLNQRQALIVAGGSWHTKDKLNKFVGGLKESDKSIDFLGNDIFEFHRSLPRKGQSEQWILGWDGVNDETLVFERGKSYNFRLRIWGEDVYGTFLRPIDRFIQVQTDCAGTDDCVEICDDAVNGVKYAKQIAEIINNDPEFAYFVKAEAIHSDMVPTTATHRLWTLTVCDNGDQQALAAVQQQFPTLIVTRITRQNSLSTYEICITIAAGTPAAFTPSQAVSLQECGVCPSGWTSVAAADIYEVKRILTPTTDISTPAAQATYAGTVNTAYTGVGTAVFLGVQGTHAVVEIRKAAGATVTALNSDQVIKVRTEGASCVAPAGTTIAWVQGADRYKTTRTLTMTLEKLCGTTNRLADLQAFYNAQTVANLSIVPGSLALTTAGTCNDIYEIQQYNNDCLVDGCLSEDVPQYDTLQSFEGFEWTEVPPVDPTDATVKVGVRITAAYEDTKFGGCSFSPLDYYSVRPLRLEIYQFDDSGNPCATQVPSRRVRHVSMPTQSGEYVIREFINANKYKAYGQFYHDPRMREALDAQIHEIVDRKKYYKIYYLKVKQNRGYLNHQGDYSPEIYEFRFFFPVDVNTTAFEQYAEKFTSQFGVYLQDR